MHLQKWILGGTILFLSQLVLAMPDKIIEVKTIAGAAPDSGAVRITGPQLSDFSEIDQYVSATAYHDETSLFLALVTNEKTLDRSLREIGLGMTFKGKKRDFSIRLQPAGGMLNGGRPVRISSGIEPLLPQYINSQLRDFMPPSDYSAYLIPDKKRRSGQLIVPEFDALYQDSSAILVVRIPLENPVYPDGVLPFDDAGKLDLEIEIGDDFFARGVMGGMIPAGGRFPSNKFGSNADDTPIFGRDEFKIALAMPAWTSMHHSQKQPAANFNLTAYLEELDQWSAQSFFGGRGGFGGGRPGPGGPPPVSFSALFAGEEIVQSGIDYVSSFLELDKSEKARVYSDFREKWQTDSAFPVLLTLRTNMHESYLDLSRWTLFVEDEDRNQYEALKIEDVSDMAARPQPNGEEDRLSRSIFSSRMKRLVLLFPRESFSGKPIWSKKGRRMKVVMISNEHPDQRLEAEWRVPK